jgi:hypothetical protein
MSSAFYIVLENTIEVDTFVDGKALSQADPLLSQLAIDAGVKPLMEFFGADSAEYADVFADTDFEPPAAKWYEANEGLQTVRMLLSNIEQNPNKFATVEAVIIDLKNFERVLAEAEEKQLRWHLAIDF